jgi:hypothetical protein
MSASINKTQLARKFGWTVEFLVKKINTSKNLYKELTEQAEYNPYQRIFTPLQVDIIYKYFGNPEK